ncbi:unnamed protein product [Peniophora sp. CBMAI 1063]|nr:unnamed protein product [Peniophora sp. CBMAI 1063]
MPLQPQDHLPQLISLLYLQPLKVPPHSPPQPSHNALHLPGDTQPLPSRPLNTPRPNIRQPTRHNLIKPPLRLPRNIHREPVRRKPMSHLHANTRDLRLRVQKHARMLALPRLDPVLLFQVQLQSGLQLTDIIAYPNGRIASAEIEQAVAHELARSVERQLPAPLRALKVRSNPPQPQTLVGGFVFGLSSSCGVYGPVLEEE